MLDFVKYIQVFSTDKFHYNLVSERDHEEDDSGEKHFHCIDG